MQTKVLEYNEESIKYAASCIKNGDIVAIPTETVYGLAADAFNEKAVSKIFTAKGRPQDNPLIVHISDLKMMDNLVSDFSVTAKKIVDKFWPGPLTIILPKSPIVPDCVTAGLNTVAVRYPSHPVAQALIKASATPLAAPSANLSGKPSPTSAKHVFDDLNGNIEVILDGGVCEVGLESTVISIDDDKICVLRPGKITVDDLKTVTDNVTVDKAVLEGVTDSAQKVSSPGMKYKHYAPKADVYILDGDFEKFVEYANNNADKDTYGLVFDNEDKMLNIPCITIGDINDYNKHAQVLFDKLRELDDIGAKKVFARISSLDGVGLAVYNRLIRAAAFRVIKL